MKGHGFRLHVQLLSQINYTCMTMMFESCM